MYGFYFLRKLRMCFELAHFEGQLAKAIICYISHSCLVCFYACRSNQHKSMCASFSIPKNRLLMLSFSSLIRNSGSNE